MGFLTSVLIARVAGPTQFGAYALGLTWITIMALVSKLGLDPGLLSFGTLYLKSGELPLFKSMVLRSLEIVMVAGLVTGGALALTRSLVEKGGARDVPEVLLIAALTVPFFACLQFTRVLLSCLRRQVSAVVAISLIQNGLMFLAVVIWFVLWRHALAPRLSGLDAIVILLGSVVIALAVAIVMLGDHLPKPRSRASRKLLRSENKKWFVVSGPLLVVAVCQFVLGRTDVVVLGAFKSIKDVGIFQGALTFTYPLAILLAFVTFAVGPELVTLHRAGQLQQVQRILSRSIEVLMAVAVPAVLILALAGHQLLRLLGTTYSSAYLAMVLLGLTQLVSLLTGSSGYALSVTGHGRIFAVAMMVTGAITMATYLLLIPKWGVDGAAWADLLTQILREVVVSIIVVRRIGVLPLPFADRFKRWRVASTGAE